MRKKTLTVVFALCLYLGLLPLPVLASTGGHTQAEAVAWANSQVGQSLDYDGSYGAQCVDLTCYYYVYLGQAVPWGNANEYVNGGQFTPVGWSYQSSPQPGDIAVDSSYSPGHVGIVTEVSGDSMVCVEQQYNSHAYCERVSRRISAHQYNTFIRPDFSASVPAPAAVSASFTQGDRFSVQEMNAALSVRLTLSGAGMTQVSRIGVCLYNASGEEIAKVDEAAGVDRDYSYLDIWYDVNSELHYTLTPGTNYKYKFFCVIGGQTYWGDEWSFTTNGRAGDPEGYFDFCVGGQGTIAIRGWAYDPDDSSSSLDIHVYIGAPAGSANSEFYAIRADKPRSDVNETIGIAGNHGFDETLTIKSYGTQSVYIYAINIGSGANKLIDSKTASIAKSVDVTGVTLNQTSLSLVTGAEAMLTATVSPSNAANKAVTWSSSNPSVATVNNGNVIAVGAGSATITATAGGKSASCAVTVEQKTGLQIGTASLSPAVVGASYHQRLVANSAETVTWSVSSGSLPTGLALSNGVISGTPTKAGSYSFTVTAANNAGTDSKTYTLTVNGNESTPKADVHFERKNIYHQDQFSDVKANQWFTNTVASAFELGLMKGNSATTFNPYGDVTVAEAITLAARIHSINSTGTESFLQTGRWYQVYLDYAYQNGIIDYAYYNSDVTQKATRAQFAEIFAGSLPSENLYAINQVEDGAVPDVSMDSTCAGSVYQLYRAGILTGSDVTGRFNPQTYITRAEAATIAARMAESNNRVSFSIRK